MKETPKNPRLSVHRKYKRRLNGLALTIDDFLYHAKMKLDPATGGGRIRGRKEIEAVVAKAQELADLLPDPDALLGGVEMPEGLLQMFEAASDETGKVLAAAPSQEELAELVALLAKMKAAGKS